MNLNIKRDHRLHEIEFVRKFGFGLDLSIRNKCLDKVIFKMLLSHYKKIDKKSGTDH